MIFGPPRREREKENPLERRTERAFPLEKPVREGEEEEEKRGEIRWLISTTTVFSDKFVSG